MALTRITKGVIKPNENYDTHNINSTGIVTAVGLDVNGNADISGNFSVGGVLTYEDVTSIDSVGIITAQKDIHVGAGVSVVGIVTAATFKGDGDFVDIDVDGHTNLDNVSIAGVSTHSEGIHIPDNKRLDFGGTAGSGDFEIRHTSNNTFLENNTGSLFISQTGNATSSPLIIHGGNELQLKHYYSNGGQLFALKSVRGYQTEIYYQGAKKIETTAKGVLVGTGVTIESNGQAEIAGITTFYKDVHIKSGTNRLYLGTADRLSLIADPNHSYLRNSGGHFQIHSDTFSVRSYTGNGSIVLFYSPLNDGNEGGGPRLYHNHGAGVTLERLRTTKSGVNIVGTTTSTQLAITGVSTFTGAIDANGDLDVDGHTNLDNVSIAGVVTATSFVGSGAQLTGIVGGKFGGGATGIHTVGNVGVQTADMTSANLVGAASSLVGLYIGDGSLLFSNNLSRSGGYYITTGVNALNAGPVSLNTVMTLDGTWVIV